MTGPRSRVLLHVGTPKSGTTYLQEVLWSNRERLRDAGVLYPGDRPDAHFLATLDLRGIDYHVPDPDTAGSWDRLAAQARAWPGTTVISHEMLAAADPGAVRHALASLSGTEVHLVVTARDLARQIPAAWQEDVKNRGHQSFGEFARDLRDRADSYFATTFWGYQDLPAILRTWGADLPPERVHVLPLARGGGRDALWRRFAEVVGVDPAAVDGDLEVQNASMGVAETNVLRLLNHEQAMDALDWPAYDALVKSFLAVDVLAARPGAVPLRLPADEHGWVEQWSKDAVEAVRAAGYDVVGDLDDLLPAPANGPDPVHPDEASGTEVRDAAVHALAAVLRRFTEERRAFDEERARFEVDRARPPGLRRALAHRVAREPWGHRALQGYRVARAAWRRRSR
ncbi:hypothetical protein [Actinophytocola sp. NPDC049390]|uniref:hypothetical protein n=1 Tax=Actinophytocola sp. NPDC049390 TaxID=3363894 RepID=UPI0037A1EACD